MASTDARPFPLKNTAYRVTFPIMDADGDLVTGATGLDSEVSKDGGTFADCTSEATEIATSSGMYYLDLTATEMNADTVAIIVKTTSSGAKTTPIVLYPVEGGDIDVDVTYINGAAVSTSTAQLGVNLVNVAGAAVSTTTAQLGVNAVQISGDGAAADNAESFFDGTGYAGTNNVIPTVTTVGTATAVTTVNGLAANSITASAIADNAIDAGAIATGAITAAKFAAGAIDAAAIATGAIDADALAADAVDEIWDEVLESTLTGRQFMRIFMAALAGKSTGGGTSTIAFRDIADSKDRISATIDGSRNRTAVTRDGS